MNAARVTRLVAGREVAEFVRERSLLTGTLMPVAVLAVVIVFLQVLEIGKSEFRVAVAGGTSEQVARAAQSYAIQSGRTILLERVADDAAVRRAVFDGRADAGIVRGGAEIVADGTGGLAYLKRDGGVPHVFASTLERGRPLPPVRVDVGMAGEASDLRFGSSTDYGAMAVWQSGGKIYAARRRTGRDAMWGPPQ